MLTDVLKKYRVVEYTLLVGILLILHINLRHYIWSLCIPGWYEEADDPGTRRPFKGFILDRIKFWKSFEGFTLERMKAIIEQYSFKHGTPSFKAHVTLMAGVRSVEGITDIVSKAERLASKIPVTTAHVERAACKDLYFQSVFALIARDKALLNAHSIAREEFGQAPTEGEDFMPHLSLLYGDLPMDIRDNICQDVNPTVRNMDIVFDTIQLWCTEGVVPQWRLVAEFPLCAPAGSEEGT